MGFQVIDGGFYRLREVAEYMGYSNFRTLRQLLKRHGFPISRHYVGSHIVPTIDIAHLEDIIALSGKTNKAGAQLRAGKAGYKAMKKSIRKNKPKRGVKIINH